MGRSSSLAGAGLVCLLAGCMATPGAGVPGECPAPGVVSPFGVITSAGTQAELHARLYVFRGDCPAATPGPRRQGDVLGRADAEADAPNVVGTQEQVVTGTEVVLDLSIPLREQLRPPWTYCARLVFSASGDRRVAATSLPRPRGAPGQQALPRPAL